MKNYYAELSKQPIIEQLQQLTHLTSDGDLIDKSLRDELVKRGLVQRFEGWNWVTEKGVAYLLIGNFINH